MRGTDNVVDPGSRFAFEVISSIELQKPDGGFLHLCPFKNNPFPQVNVWVPQRLQLLRPGCSTKLDFKLQLWQMIIRTILFDKSRCRIRLIEPPRPLILMLGVRRRKWYQRE